MSELRYHPFLETWVMVATHRQDRTFHPPADFCPLCPTASGGFPTEIPFESYDIVVFENRFPSLSPSPEAPSIAGDSDEIRPSVGVCEVVCYSDKHDGSFAELTQRQARQLARVWQDRYRELSARPEIAYVFIFENKGAAIGVTLSHPHGQIYGYPFVPPIPAQELSRERERFERTGVVLMEEWLEQELVRDSGVRLVAQNDSFAAVVPRFARYPYEVHVVSTRGRASLGPMEPTELDELSDLLLTVTRAYDRLFGFSLPYIMAMHQFEAPYARFHVEFYPPNRTADKLKFLAGSESGAGAFINDVAPEAAAKRLRACVAELD